MRHWLLKTEPDVFSLEDLRRKGTAPWDGVRNYQARNHLRTMAVGDLAFIYHSSTAVTGIVGLGTVVRPAYPDPTALDRRHPQFDPKSDAAAPRWDAVDIAFLEALPRIVTLAELREDPECRGLVLLENSRLSVQPVSPAHFHHICARAARPAAPPPVRPRRR